ncbi:hypothetical protein E2C01_069883 [Portunus trituberculatus]|uniref:Uncharacterized protein n=1 Tax=Portunus trituberculatus TaxID=210409 RepID=A0A5B7HZR6_PORTR|nr:hypothetical protein [Portunus trituberculatus]
MAQVCGCLRCVAAHVSPQHLATQGTMASILSTATSSLSPPLPFLTPLRMSNLQALAEIHEAPQL